MAVKLGYGGIANTNGARDFSGKTAAPIVATASTGPHLYRAGRGFLSFLAMFTSMQRQGV